MAEAEDVKRYLGNGWQYSKSPPAQGSDNTVYYVRKGAQEAVLKIPKDSYANTGKLMRLVAQDVIGVPHLEQRSGTARKPAMLFKRAIGRRLDELSDNLREHEREPIAVQIGLAMDALHKLGWSHNDLHLGNIIYDRDTQSITIIDYSRAGPNCWPHAFYRPRLDKWWYPGEVQQLPYRLTDKVQNLSGIYGDLCVLLALWNVLVVTPIANLGTMDMWREAARLLQLYFFETDALTGDLMLTLRRIWRWSLNQGTVFSGNEVPSYPAGYPWSAWQWEPDEEEIDPTMVHYLEQYVFMLNAQDQQNFEAKRFTQRELQKMYDKVKRKRSNLFTSSGSMLGKRTRFSPTSELPAKKVSNTAFEMTPKMDEYLQLHVNELTEAPRRKLLSGNMTMREKREAHDWLKWKRARLLSSTGIVLPRKTAAAPTFETAEAKKQKPGDSPTEPPKKKAGQ